MPDSGSDLTGMVGALSSPAPLRIGRKVVAFIDDEATSANIRIGLAALGDDLDLRQGTVHAGIRYFAKETPGQAIIVDIGGTASPQGALDELAHVCPPNVQVFAVGDNADSSFHRLLVYDLGLTEYLAKPLTPDMVLRHLLPHLSDSAEIGTGGQLVAVCGARGGVGTSSIALNLAYELVGRINGDVALLDLHIQGGKIALMLSARPGPALRIALEDGRRVDSLFLERVSIALGPRLRLIAAEDSFDSDLVITESGLRQVLSLLQQKFSFIIADIPMPLPSPMMQVLTQARRVATVLAPDAASLRDTQNIRQFVTSVTGSDRIITVLNRADTKGGIGMPLIEKTLGIKPDIIIPDLGRRMLEASNMGRPAVRHVPALRRHLAPLVGEVAGVASDAALAPWWRRLFR